MDTILIICMTPIIASAWDILPNLAMVTMVAVVIREKVVTIFTVFSMVS
jgi:hypothetical protein